MNILDIGIAAAIVDFATIVLSKFFNMGTSLDKWYSKFGMTAVLSDVLVMVLGIQLALLFVPKAGIFLLLVMAVCIQIIDLFKDYANENSWKIVVYDSLMIGSTVFLAHTLAKIQQMSVNFIGVLTVYALTYIVYTK